MMYGRSHLVNILNSIQALENLAQSTKLTFFIDDDVFRFDFLQDVCLQKFGKCAVLVQQLGVSANLGYPAIDHHDNEVELRQITDAVRYEQSCLEWKYGQGIKYTNRLDRLGNMDKMSNTRIV